MTGAAIVTLVAKVTVVVSLGLLCLRLARRQSAAFRHVLASTTLTSAALVPLAAASLPSFPVVVATREIRQAPVAIAPGSLTPHATSPVVTASESRIALTGFLMIGWATGAGVCLLPLLAIGHQSRRIVRHGRACGVAQVTVRTLTGRRRRAIPVLLHRDLTSPVVCGMVRPAIALPTSSQAWSVPDVDRAVLHELAHVRRRDMLVQAVARVVCAAYWFHPLVWVCWRRLRLEAERACDDAVLARFEPTDYASQLIRIARGGARGLAARVLPAMSHRGELSSRVESILDVTQCRAKLSALHALPAILLGVAIAAVTGGVTPTIGYAVRERTLPVTRFASASIRESIATAPMTLVREEDGAVRITGATLQVLLRLAYGVQAPGIVDAPAWAASTRFDIEATPPQPASTEATLSMLRALLAERFGLRVAPESRLQRVIVVGLPADAIGSPTRCDPTPAHGPRRSSGGLPPCGFQVGQGQIEATAVDAEALAATLSTTAGVRVLVESARSGRFDLRLHWRPNGSDASPLLDALRTQAGATITEAERRLPVLAVRAVHRPT